jgi:hypothetical protein
MALTVSSVPNSLDSGALERTARKPPSLHSRPPDPNPQTPKGLSYVLIGLSPKVWSLGSEVWGVGSEISPTPPQHCTHVLPDIMYLLICFGKSTPPPNRQFNILICNGNQ